MLWNWNLHFPLYLNIVVLNGQEICTTSDEVLAILGEGHTLNWVLFPGRAGAASRTLVGCLSASIASSHDTGFRLSPLLSQTAIAICTFMHWLLLWQSRMHLSLRSLKFSWGLEIFDPVEKLFNFLHSHWNLCKLQISPVPPAQKSLDVNVLCLNSLREYRDSLELMLCSGHFYSSYLKMCICISARGNFFPFTS